MSKTKKDAARHPARTGAGSVVDMCGTRTYREMVTATPTTIREKVDRSSASSKAYRKAAARLSPPVPRKR